MENTIKRRALLQAAVSAVIGGCGGSDSTSAGMQDPKRPNILMIAIDDLNDWVGFLGNTQVKTPNMDVLAARSTMFRHAYCTAPVCSASRAGILSGLSARSTGVYDLLHTFKSVNPKKRQFDEMLATQGYTVMRAGKIDHNYQSASKALPLPKPQPYSNKKCFSSYGEGAFDWGPIPGTDENMPDYVYGQRGIDFLKNHTGGPFCASIGFFRPHVAWYVPQRYFDMYPLDKIVLPPAPTDDLNDIGPAGKAVALKWNFHNCIIQQNLWADAVRAYLSCITWVDTQVGRLIAALDASPYADNTIVVLWSDHGFHLGEKFHWHKMALWEEATHVPFLIRMPKQAKGHVVEACVSLRDLAPTLLDLTQSKSDYTMDGRSLKPLLENPNTTWDHPALTTMNANDHAVRTNKWRYIRYASGEEELYDKEVDPKEYHNIAAVAGYEEVKRELSGYMPSPV